MRIEYLHASKYGNGAMVAAEFAQRMAANDIVVGVHHIREVRPTELSPADLYVFSSPGRVGKPTRGMRRFLKRVKLPTGSGLPAVQAQGASAPRDWARGAARADTRRSPAPPFPVHSTAA